jgi:hypothetical protein
MSVSRIPAKGAVRHHSSSGLAIVRVLSPVLKQGRHEFHNAM